MKNNISVELLEKYINGTCNAEEALQVKNWYLSFEQDDDHVSSLSAIEEKSLADFILNQILSNIEKADPDFFEDKAAAPALKAGKWWLAAAAAAAVIAIAIGVVFFNKTSLGLSPAQSLPPAHEVVVINNSKTIYKEVLPDSSVVWISPDSRLTYPKTFTGNTREVSMRGECFYQVTKNPQRPFIINSGNIITKVWGTSFRVRDLDQATLSEVSVVTGKVSVSISKKGNVDHVEILAANEVMLYPHQKVTYLHEGNILRTSMENDARSLHIWDKVNLSFDNTPLREIIPVLEMKFKIKISVPAKTLDHDVWTADITEFNLPEVLEVLKKSLGLTYRMDGGHIYLEDPII